MPELKYFGKTLFITIYCLTLHLSPHPLLAAPPLKAYAGCDAHLIRIIFLQPTTSNQTPQATHLICYALDIKDKELTTEIMLAEALDLNAIINEQHRHYTGDTSLYYTQQKNQLIKIKTTVFTIPPEHLIDWNGELFELPEQNQYQARFLYSYNQNSSPSIRLTRHEADNLILAREEDINIVNACHKAINLPHIYFAAPLSNSNCSLWPGQQRLQLPASIHITGNDNTEHRHITIKQLVRKTPLTAHRPMASSYTDETPNNVVYLPEHETFEVTYRLTNHLTDDTDAICVLPSDRDSLQQPSSDNRGYKVELNDEQKQAGLHTISINSLSDPVSSSMFSLVETGPTLFNKWYRTEAFDSFRVFFRTSKESHAWEFSRYTTQSLSTTFDLSKYRNHVPPSLDTLHTLHLKVSFTPQPRISNTSYTVRAQDSGLTAPMTKPIEALYRTMDEIELNTPH